MLNIQRGGEMSRPAIIVISGSTRTGSIHKQLAELVTEKLRATEVEVTLLDLSDFPMPLFDADLLHRDGPPDSAHELRAIIGDHHGLVIASPEYNGAMTPLLKNTVDWVSRVDMFTLFGKLIGLMAASPGGGGGAKVLAMTSGWLSSIGANVFAETFSAPSINEHLVDGDLDEETNARLTDFSSHFASWAVDKVAAAEQNG